MQKVMSHCDNKSLSTVWRYGYAAILTQTSMLIKSMYTQIPRLLLRLGLSQRAEP